MTTHDPSKVGSLARVRFSSALMSDTKWRKLIGGVHSAELGVKQMVAKFIDAAEPRIMVFPPSLNCPYPYMDTIEFGPVELRSIEWVELPADVTAIADGLGKFPLEQVAGGTRIVGYRV